MKNSRILYFCGLFLFIYTLLPAQETDLATMAEFYPEEIQIAGFRIDAEQDLDYQIRTIAPRHNYREFHFSYAWILNAETRKVVWELRDAEMDDRDRYIATYAGEISLPPGTYEVYYSTYPHFNFDDDFYFHWGARGFFSGLFNAIFDDNDIDRYRYFEELYDELYLNIKGSGTAMIAEQIDQGQNALKEKSFIAFTSMRDDEYEEQIFEVKEPVNLRIYALGEARRDGDYDFGTILNLETRERVWHLGYRYSDDAGGATKNRVVDEVLSLEPGIYKVLYVTDDSHSYRRWNSAPPFDPSFWGLTIWPEDESKAKLVKRDNDLQLSQHTIIEFTKVRSEDYLVQGFSLKKALDLHIYALGEGSDGDMYDYGWIVDTKTRNKVWEMDYYDTEPAGGSSKNRLFDGILNLGPGDYMVYFITDDSHAYRDWNESPPYDRKSWGITIRVVDDDYSAGDVEEYEEQDDPNILARIIRVRDNERLREEFTVDEDGYVRVYAIGEGTRGEMYDYAWIENAATGRIVWEMTYRMTDRAGGARKNRKFDDRIYLERGQYIVFYETDDSHSFNDWNERPPRDPFSWGVTINRAE